MQIDESGRRAILHAPIMGRHPERSDRGASEPGLPAVSDTDLLQLMQELSACADFACAASTLCSRLALVLGASRVVLGWRRAARGPTRPLALSGSGLPQWDAETQRGLMCLLDEAVDQAQAVVYPSPPEGRLIVHAHEKWCRQHGLAAVLTMPMASRGRAVGAVLAEFSRPAPSASMATLARVVSMAAPWLSLLDAHRPSRIKRLRAHWGAAIPRRIGWGVAVILVAFVGLPRTVTISAPARIEGALQRSVAAPIPGYLKSVAVRPGDVVRQGQVLAELGDRDLDLEFARLTSEVAQHAAAVRAAMARGDRPAMAIDQARHDEAAGRLALIEHQLEQIRLRAPIDGVVLEGDLAQQVGAPIDRGRPLFVLAPPQRYRVVIELDERDLSRVRLQQVGHVGVAALPWDSVPFEVTRIAPAATVQEGRHVFEIQARLTEERAGMRPGQRGTAHLQVGQAPWVVHAGRRMIDALGRLIWRWWP